MRRDGGTPKKKSPPPVKKKYVGSSRSTSGTQFVRSVPRERDRQPAKRAAVIFGAQQGVFLPDALAPPPPRQPKGRPTQKLTPQQQARAAEQAEKLRYHAAMLAPVSQRAKVTLRQTETPVERQVREGTLRPPPGRSAISRIEGVTGAPRRALGKAAGVGVDIAGALAQSAAQGLISRAYEGAGAQSSWASAPQGSAGLRGGAAGGRLGADVLADVAGPGAQLTRAITGQEYDPSGLKWDVVFAPLLLGGALGGVARGGRGAAKVVREAEKADVAAARAAQAIERSGIKTMPDRQAAYEAIAALTDDPDAAAKAAQRMDHVVHQQTKQIKGRAARQKAAAEIYRDFTGRTAAAPDDATFVKNEVAIQEGARAKHLPPQASTPETLGALVTDLKRRLQEGLSVGSGWYRESGEAIRDYSGGNLDTADKLAALTALYSPQQAVVPNIGLALRAMEEFRLSADAKGLNGVITVGGEKQIERATAVMNGKNWLDLVTDPDQAMKIKSFYGNLLKYVDYNLMREQGFTGREVTADGWIGAAFGYGFNTTNTSLSPSQYRFIERTIQRLADEQGLSPDDAQAAIWMSIKAERDRYLAATYKTDPQAALERAGDTFLQGLEKQTHNMRMAVEAASSEKPWLAKLTTQQQAEYTNEVATGVVRSLQDMGVPAKLTDEGTGFYLNDAGDLETNPAFAIEVPVGARPRTRKGAVGKVEKELYQTITPEQQSFYDGLAATINRGLSQEGGGWIRPLVSSSPTDHTAWRIRPGRQLTTEEMQIVAQKLDGDNFYLTQTTDGFMVVRRNPDSHLALTTKERQASRKSAERHVVDVLDNVLGEEETTRLAANDGILGYTHRGGYVDRARFEDSIRTSGRPDFLDGLAGRIGTVVGDADARWRAVAERGRAARVARGAASRVGEALQPAPPGIIHPAFRKAAARSLAPHEALTPLPGQAAMPSPAAAIEPPTPESAAKRVRGAVRGSAEAREQQRILRLEEAAERSRKLDEAMRGLEGEEAIQAAKRALRGELPKVEFGGLRDLDQETFTLMANHITGHPRLQGYEKIRAHDALVKMIRGQVPQPNEVTLLNKAFGDATVKSLTRERTKLQRLRKFGIQLYHLPRTMMSTFDLSFGMRQSLVPMARHPRIFYRNWMKMHRQFASQEVFDMTARNIVEDPLYPMMKHYGVEFSDLGDDVWQREEQILSPLGESKAFKKVGVGHVVAASSRAYTGMANTQRADLFKATLDRLQRYIEKQGYDLESYPDRDHALESIATLVNAATGRGSAKHDATKNALKGLQYLLFSPRLLKSRLDFMNPFWYASLHPVARREALEQFATMTAMVGSVLGLAKMAGAEVGLDPRDSDFAKIKIGDTRIDLLGGFQQVTRYGAQIMWQNALAIKQLKETGGKLEYEQWQDPGSTFLRFIRSKLAPVPSAIVDTQMGEDFRGQPVNVVKAAYERMVPILISDLIQMYQAGYPKEALLPYPLALYGIGVSTYERKQPTPSERSQEWLKPDSGEGKWWEEEDSDEKWWK